jgi:hypothetical protein
MAENGAEYKDDPAVAAALYAPKYGIEGLQEYQERLRGAEAQLPGLMAQSYMAGQGAIAKSKENVEAQRRNAARQQAAALGRAMAGAMGGAGAMPTGGGAAASLRQTGMDFGRGAADLAMLAADRQSELEREGAAGRQSYLQDQMSYLAETLPGFSLGRSRAAGEEADIARAAAEGRTGSVATAQNTINTILANDMGSAPTASALSQMWKAEMDPNVKAIYEEALRTLFFDSMVHDIGNPLGEDFEGFVATYMPGHTYTPGEG